MFSENIKKEFLALTILILIIMLFLSFPIAYSQAENNDSDDSNDFSRSDKRLDRDNILSISSTGEGTVKEPGEGNYLYENGTEVQLKAVANENYDFIRWRGDTDTIRDIYSAETTINVTGDYSINAKFEGIKPTWSGEIFSTGTTAAVYDSNIGAPICNFNTSTCIANSSLLMSRNDITGETEPNWPNTIDDCTDGTSGSYMSYESVENITITNNEESYFTKGHTINVSAWVYCHSTDTDVGVVYTNNISEPNWENKQALSCPESGFEKINFEPFELDNSTGYHAVRAYAYYETGGLNPQTCAPGSWADNDDVVFYVNQEWKVGVETSLATNVTYESAELQGEITELEKYEEADVYFEYREKGETWQNTTTQKITETQTFSEKITNLRKNTIYEFRAIVEANGDTDIGRTLKFVTADWHIVKPDYFEEKSWKTNSTEIKDLEEIEENNLILSRYVEYALDFDGVDDYIEMDKPIIPENDDFVFEVEVKVDSEETATSLLLAQRDDDDGDRDFSLYTVSDFGDANNEVAVWLRGADDPSNFLIGNDIRGEGWVNITLEREGNTWRLYQNGSLLDQAVRDNEIAQVHTSLFARARHWDRQTEGQLRKASITNPKSSWPMNEGEDDKIYDELNNNNGTLRGNPQWLLLEEEFFTEGHRISKPYQTEIENVGENRMQWESTEPTDTDINISYAITDTETAPSADSADWEQTNNNESFLEENLDLTDKYLWFKQELKREGTETPVLESQTTYISEFYMPVNITDIKTDSDTYDPGSNIKTNFTVRGTEEVDNLNVSIWHPTEGSEGEENWDIYFLENGTWDNIIEKNETTRIYEWSFNLSQHAHYTNETTGEYKIKAQANSDGETDTKQVDGFNVTKMTGISLQTTDLSVDGKIGESEVSFNENPIKITHTGNVDQDILVSGTDLTNNGHVIRVGNISYSDEGTPKYQLTETDELFTEISPMNRGTYPEATVKDIYYWLNFPLGNPAGDYTGTIFISTELS